MSEAELQAAVEDLCDELGLMHWHDYDSRRNEPGFPDLVIVGRRVMFVELKSESGILKSEQWCWLHAIQDADGVEYRMYKPRHWRAGIIRRDLTELSLS